MDAPLRKSVRFFDEQFQKQIREGDFALNPFEERVLPWVRGDVLDLGCGLGNLSVRAAERGCRVHAVDGSPSAIERLRRRAQDQALPLEAVQADLATFAIDRRYDTVVCIGLLMFFGSARARALLAEVQEAVRPGGIAAVNALVHGTTFTAMFDPDEHHLFEPTDLESAFAAWRLLHASRETFPAPEGTKKVFSTVIARRVA